MSHEPRYIPANLNYPPLSLLGFKPGTPERQLYVFGFTAVTVLFLGMAFPLWARLTAAVRDDRGGRVGSSMIAALAAFTGLWMHAVVPLQPDIIEVMEGRVDGANLMSGAHQMAAGIFFMASMYCAQKSV